MTGAGAGAHTADGERLQLAAELESVATQGAEPERLLLAAVLQSAFVSLDRESAAATETRGWLASEAVDALDHVAFVDVCEHLGLNLARWRTALLAIVPRPRGRQLPAAEVFAVRRRLRRGETPFRLAIEYRCPEPTIQAIGAGTYYLLVRRRQQRRLALVPPTAEQRLRAAIRAEIATEQRKLKQLTRALAYLERAA